MRALIIKTITILFVIILGWGVVLLIVTPQLEYFEFLQVFGDKLILKNPFKTYPSDDILCSSKEKFRLHTIEHLSSQDVYECESSNKFGCYLSVDTFIINSSIAEAFQPLTVLDNNELGILISKSLMEKMNLHIGQDIIIKSSDKFIQAIICGSIPYAGFPYFSGSENLALFLILNNESDINDFSIKDYYAISSFEHPAINMIDVTSELNRILFNLNLILILWGIFVAVISCTNIYITRWIFQIRKYAIQLSLLGVSKRISFFRETWWTFWDQLVISFAGLICLLFFRAKVFEIGLIYYFVLILSSLIFIIRNFIKS